MTVARARRPSTGRRSLAVGIPSKGHASTTTTTRSASIAQASQATTTTTSTIPCRAKASKPSGRVGAKVIGGGTSWTRRKHGKRSWWLKLLLWAHHHRRRRRGQKCTWLLLLLHLLLLLLRLLYGKHRRRWTRTSKPATQQRFGPVGPLHVGDGLLRKIILVDQRPVRRLGVVLVLCRHQGSRLRLLRRQHSPFVFFLFFHSLSGTI